jgi:hypothetical protein
MGGVHCNAYHSKSMILKLGFLVGSITTNDEPVLLTIEGKWLETIMHMIKFEFLNLHYPKQIQLIIPMCIHDKFQLLFTFAFICFQKDIQ